MMCESQISIILFFFVFYFLQTPTEAARKSYVVYLGTHVHGSDQPSSTLDKVNRIAESHYDLLGSCLKSKKKAREAIFYSYTNYINGFAATLEEDEVQEISKHPHVVSIFADEAYELHTTKSWEFLGLEKNGEIPAESLWVKAKFGEDVIIGNLDTGVWPESKSFNDEGIGPIPSKWKGRCDTNDNVKCNRKLIGARYFNRGFEAHQGTPLNSSYNTARDIDGHGTHTLATAGGAFVPGANLLGAAYGIAKGGAPKARVASYKVCWPSCYDADILAAFDAAIYDGVDILSISLGSRPRHYLNHGISIGSFHAVANGILVVCSAGNAGPSESTVSNVAPWILTVAASTISRNFTSNAILGNKRAFKGLSFNTNSLPVRNYYPLVNSLAAKVANDTFDDAQFCTLGTLEPSKIKGKIVYCVSGFNRDIEKSWVIAQAGGIGMILSSFHATPKAHFVPTSVVSNTDDPSILAYINSTKFPKAYISGATEVGKAVAPVMASFSSLGPNLINPEILKPDITAPGVDIIAAYTEARGPSSFYLDNRQAPFNILSGTSMSCPHVAGVAALLKSLHPRWSPAAIRSAIMTTASTKSDIGKPISNETLGEATPFSYGSGHIWPSRAANPGLVYDITLKDYLNFLCSIGYNKTERSIFAIKPFNCPSTKISLLDFNYPSITVPNLSGSVTLTRTLKNVGTPGTYKVQVKAPKGISIEIDPMILKFNMVSEEKSFKVTIKTIGNMSNDYVFGKMVWSDEVHNVRSPIVVKKA